jgi:hypothetical protein
MEICVRRHVLRSVVLSGFVTRVERRRRMRCVRGRGAGVWEKERREEEVLSIILLSLLPCGFNLSPMHSFKA